MSWLWKRAGGGGLATGQASSLPGLLQQMKGKNEHKNIRG
jgi:hypothetical protein